MVSDEVMHNIEILGGKVFSVGRRLDDTDNIHFSYKDRQGRMWDLRITACENDRGNPFLKVEHDKYITYDSSEEICECCGQPIDYCCDDEDGEVEE